MKKPIYTVSFALLVVISAIFSLSPSSGSIPNHKGCSGSGGCHETPPSPQIAIGVFFNDQKITTYTPFKTYRVKIYIDDTTNKRMKSIGFNAKCNIGTMAAADYNTLISSTGNEIYHSPAKVPANATQSTFEFDWKVPFATYGTAVFSIDALISDYNADRYNDTWNSKTIILYEDTSLHTTISSVVASNITNSSAKISANIIHYLSYVTVLVEYGTSISYDSALKTTPSHPGGNTNTPIYVNLSNLKPNTLYHYRFKVSSSLDTPYYSPDYTFTTKDTTGSSIIANVMKEKIELYPNPSNNYCMLTGPVEIQSCMAIDIEGKSRSLPFENIKTNTFKINTSHLKEGVYYITYSDRKGQRFFTKNQLIVTH